MFVSRVSPACDFLRDDGRDSSLEGGLLAREVTEATTVG